jgi:hypothetical protein
MEVLVIAVNAHHMQALALMRARVECVLVLPEWNPVRLLAERRLAHDEYYRELRNAARLELKEGRPIRQCLERVRCADDMHDEIV